MIIMIDVLLKEDYYINNIPARPLLQDMLNHGGFYYFEGEPIGVPAGRAIGMCLEIQI